MIKDFYSIVSNAVASTDVGSRVYNLTRQHSQDNPFIVFQKISDNRSFNLCNGDSLRTAIIQLDIYSNHRDNRLLDITDSVESISGTYTGICIQSIKQENQFDSYESEERLHKVTTDFLITYKK